MWLFLLLAAPILLSFLLFEQPLLSISRSTIEAIASPDLKASMVAGLLALDILLPVPSSVVSTLAATALDAPRAIAAITIGSTASALLGWSLGRWLRGSAMHRLVDAASLAEADALFARYGLWTFAATRAVPILAEELAILAGVHRVPPLRVLLPLTVAANLPMAAFYVLAVRGAAIASGEEPAFWLLAIVASAPPLVGLAIARAIRGRRNP